MKTLLYPALAGLLLLLSSTSQAQALNGVINGGQSGTLEYACDLQINLFALQASFVCDGHYNNYSNIPTFQLDGDLSFSLETDTKITTAAFNGGPLNITTPSKVFETVFDNVVVTADVPNDDYSIYGSYTSNGELITINNDAEALVIFTILLY